MNSVSPAGVILYMLYDTAQVTESHERILLSAVVFTRISPTFPIVHHGVHAVAMIGSDAKSAISD